MSFSDRKFSVSKRDRRFSTTGEPTSGKKVHLRSLSLHCTNNLAVSLIRRYTVSSALHMKGIAHMLAWILREHLQVLFGLLSAHMSVYTKFKIRQVKFK